MNETRIDLEAEAARVRAELIAFRDLCLWFRHVLNNALLHVMDSAAHNRHGLLQELLDHPNLPGGYTHLMPHYILGVILKVRALRALAVVEAIS